MSHPITRPAKPASAEKSISALAEAVRNAAASPFLPGGVRDALPLLVEVLRAQQAELQELRELVRQPCEGCGQRLVEAHSAEG